MVVGEIAEGVDLLVVGGGPGGYVAALWAAQLGRSVTLVERGGPAGLGGVCVRVGCIPSKALIETARSAWSARHGSARGVRVGEVTVDLADFQTWRRDVVHQLSSGVGALLAQAGVTVLTGTARLTRPRTVAVETARDTVAHLQFEDCVLATGSRPVGLPHLRPNGRRVLDSTGALALERLPERVVVVGGGYVGLEIGTALAQLGSAVTLVEAADRLLPAMEEEVVEPVVRRLADLGVQVRTRTLVVEDTGAEVRTRSLDTGQEHALVCDVVVVAVGRVPNTDDLGLDLAGVAVGDAGLLDVAPDRRIAPHLAAVGDVTPGPALAHKAMAEAHVAVEALCGRPVAFEPAAVPAVVFSDPEIAVTGLSQAQALGLGYEVSVGTFPLSASGRVATLGRRDGFVRLVSDAASGVLLGAQLVGEHVSELVGEATLAVEMGATVLDLSLTVHPHPTVSEALVDAAHVALGSPVHVARRRP